ncbi:MAG TPA: hypothetical protein PKD45_07405 [Flavobacteriales bacterium]|nr:hypothetical protein [Flavobacteriales bacterium]
MNEGLSKTGAEGLRKRLDEAVVLLRTVEQLRKDLREEALEEPPVGDGAFEDLRAQVLRVLEEREGEGPHAFGLVVNRVDLTERQLRSAMAAGGLHALAGAVVLRCLQKVLSRMRYAGLA